MGKKKTTSRTSTPATDAVNKTQAIKAALAAHRDKGPTEIAAMLNEQGMDVSPAYVSTIKSSLKKKKKAGTKKAASGQNQYAPLYAAKKLVEQVGSAAEAKKAIDTIGKLLD